MGKLYSNNALVVHHRSPISDTDAPYDRHDMVYVYKCIGEIPIITHTFTLISCNRQPLFPPGLEDLQYQTLIKAGSFRACHFAPLAIPYLNGP